VSNYNKCCHQDFYIFKDTKQSVIALNFNGDCKGICKQGKRLIFNGKTQTGSHAEKELKFLIDNDYIVKSNNPFAPRLGDKADICYGDSYKPRKKADKIKGENYILIRRNYNTDKFVSIA
jgi:hypothetical protein